MKTINLVIVFFFPFFAFSQHIQSLSQPPPPNAQLLQLNSYTIMVHPIDLNNTAHKWVSFDTALQIIAAKKLVTPNAENIINQTYLESSNSILRIDQLYIDSQFYVTAYIFDRYGNLVKNEVVYTAPIASGNPSSFQLSQSPDKRYVSLVQALLLQQDSLNINGIIIDAGLSEVNKFTLTTPFDTEISEMYSPFLSNQAGLFVPIADKFDSYKLSSALELHFVPVGSRQPQKLNFEFGRKKLKNYQFHTSGDTVLISALYSNGEDKSNIAGINYTGYVLSNDRHLQQQSFAYSSGVQTELKQAFGRENRKGNLLNYIIPLPDQTNAPATYNYAFLLAAQELLNQPHVKKAPNSPPNIDAVRHPVGHVKGLEGTTLLGSNKPMTFNDASVYAATVGAIGSGFPVEVVNHINLKEQMKRTSNKKNAAQSKNLLLFSLSQKELNITPFKIQQMQDPLYSFFTYLPTDQGYSAIYYTMPSVKKAQLQQTTIQPDGHVVNKRLWDHASLILLGDYDFVIKDNSLVAFYEDKISGQMGLLKIKL